MQAVLSERVKGLKGVTITAERVTFANGARCDLLHVDGRLPFATDLRKASGEVTDLGTLVVAGADQGETEHNSASTGFSTAPPVRYLEQQVLGTVVYLPTEGGTMPASPFLPPAWQGQPYTYTHTRTTMSATFGARKGEEKHFRVTPATRAAAARRLERDLALASSAADRRDARRTHRLALRGIRLEMKPFRARWSGELPG